MVVSDWSRIGDPTNLGLLRQVRQLGGMSRCLLKFSKRSLRIEIYAASAI